MISLAPLGSCCWCHLYPILVCCTSLSKTWSCNSGQDLLKQHVLVSVRPLFEWGCVFRLCAFSFLFWYCFFILLSLAKSWVIFLPFLALWYCVTCIISFCLILCLWTVSSSPRWVCFSIPLASADLVSAPRAMMNLLLATHK